MTAAERNQATLVELYKHLGPGLHVGMDAYRRSLTEDCVWWTQDWAPLIGHADLEHQFHITGLWAAPTRPRPLYGQASAGDETRHLGANPSI